MPEMAFFFDKKWIFSFLFYERISISKKNLIFCSFTYVKSMV